MKKNMDMRSLLKIALGIFASITLLSACGDDDAPVITELTLAKEDVTLGAEGGVETVNVSSPTKWVAKVSVPWLKISPANGLGSTDCEIKVDTTLTNTVREGIVTFVSENNERKTLAVHQTGYGKMIGLSKETIEVENMGDYDKRFFEISVTSNVDFTVKVPDGIKWVSVNKQPSISLDYGARPRTVKVRFNWEMNTEPAVRVANISFEPKNTQEVLEKEAILEVSQKAAPKIDDNRQGDSIALLIIQEKLRAMATWETSEKMDYWAGVTLWEKTDEGVTAEMIGRLRSVDFRLFNTKEGLPKELSYLTYLERLYLMGNTNTALLPDKFSMGTALADLKHLKQLVVSGYGIATIDVLSELKEPRKTLEYLNLSGNNFVSYPAALSANNFPELKGLEFSGMRRYDTHYDLRDNVWQANWGLRINIEDLANLFKWEKLEELSLSYCYIYGQLPDFQYTYGLRNYTDEDILANDTLQSASPETKALLKNTRRILPNLKRFSINLNFMTGQIPNWLMYHPRLTLFDPFTLIFNQDHGYDPNGKVPGFTNVPANTEELYKIYPKARPVRTE